MKRNVTQCEFSDAFRDMGRGDSFSYEGKRALYDYLEQHEEDCGEEIELDVIAICCDYSEYDTALEAAREYGFEPEEVDEAELSPLPSVRDICDPAWRGPTLTQATQEREEEKEEIQDEAAVEWLNDRTCVITFDGGVIIQGF